MLGTVSDNSGYPGPEEVQLYRWAHPSLWTGKCTTTTILCQPQFSRQTGFYSFFLLHVPGKNFWSKPRCPLCHPTNRVKTLMESQKHWCQCDKMTHVPHFFLVNKATTLPSGDRWLPRKHKADAWFGLVGITVISVFFSVSMLSVGRYNRQLGGL